MVKNVVVTAANDAYFNLLEGMVKSYHQNAKRDDTDLCVIDLGLTGEQRARISSISYAIQNCRSAWFRRTRLSGFRVARD